MFLTGHDDQKGDSVETINVADAKSRLSELLSRVTAGERFLIQRRERPVAVLIGADELDRLERNARVARRLAAALGQDETLLEAIGQGAVHPAMAVFGLWRDDPEMADLAERLAANRANQPVRPTPEL
jgi:prevent-host-death family protein